jgi:L-iditol 2-dehydrogenase
MCEQGHPNLCLHLRFCGNHPYDGSLRQWMHMPARSCFPVPETLDDAQTALLEALGIALHAADLARLRVADSLAILGAGPIGLLILQVARLAGADPIFISDKFPWRLRLAEQFGGIPLPCDDAVRDMAVATGGHGVDTAIEAAWGDESVGQAADVVRLGGRVVLVGIPSVDRLSLKHSTARRKGVTIRFSRRMKHTYPRSIRLATRGRVNLSALISHRFPLTQAAAALALNAAYQDQVVKVVVENT